MAKVQIRQHRNKALKDFFEVIGTENPYIVERIDNKYVVKMGRFVGKDKIVCNGRPVRVYAYYTNMHAAFNRGVIR